jgi:hypothetical protein
MASDFSLALQNRQPIKTISSVGSATFHEIKYPSITKRISIGCENTELYVSFSYEDGDASSLVDTVFVPKNNLYTMTVPNGTDSVFVVAKAGTASNVVFIMEEFT